MLHISTADRVPSGVERSSQQRAIRCKREQTLAGRLPPIPTAKWRSELARLGLRTDFADWLSDLINISRRHTCDLHQAIIACRPVCDGTQTFFLDNVAYISAGNASLGDAFHGWIASALKEIGTSHTGA